MPAAVQELESLDRRQRGQRRRELTHGRHHGIAQKHRDDRNPALEGREKLAPNEVVGVIDAPPPSVAALQPLRPDEGEHDVAAIERSDEHFGEVPPGLDVVDVKEDLILTEARDERVVDAEGIAGGVIASVAHEDPRRRGRGHTTDLPIAPTDERSASRRSRSGGIVRGAATGRMRAPRTRGGDPSTGVACLRGDPHRQESPQMARAIGRATVPPLVRWCGAAERARRRVPPLWCAGCWQADAARKYGRR